jgi:hypothetical protein
MVSGMRFSAFFSSLKTTCQDVPRVLQHTDFDGPGLDEPKDVRTHGRRQNWLTSPLFLTLDKRVEP